MGCFVFFCESIHPFLNFIYSKTSTNRYHFQSVMQFSVSTDRSNIVVVQTEENCFHELQQLKKTWGEGQYLQKGHMRHCFNPPGCKAILNQASGATRNLKCPSRQCSAACISNLLLLKSISFVQVKGPSSCPAFVLSSQLNQIWKQHCCH